MDVEVWLRPNTRALWFGTLLPIFFGALGLWLAVWPPAGSLAAALRVGGIVVAVVSLIVLAALVVQTRLPRLAYGGNHLLVRLTAGAPIRVPIEIVECFWLGQAATMLPGKEHDKTEASSVVIRLAESATEWRHREVKPQLGMWCEGYITIRGTWCERLSIDVVNRLNQRLADVTAEARSQAG